MAGFQDIIGQEQICEHLQTALKLQKVSHAYIINGERNSGKKFIARIFAMALQCTGEGEKPCQVCRSCRQALSENHPDIIRITHEKPNSIGVEDIRTQVNNDMGIKPYQGPYKVYLIEEAEKMTVQAQNALLKTLEEPPEYAVFLLLTDNPNKMLPTIRSRCTALNLNALPEETLRSALHREFPEAAKETLESALERSGGFLGQAKVLMTQAESPQTKQFVEVYLNGKDREYAELLCPMEKWKRDQLSQELTAWRTLLADALLSRGGMRASSPLAARIAEKRQGGDLLSAKSH